MLLPVPLAFAAFHMATLIAPVSQAKLPEGDFPLARVRCGIVAVSATLGGAGFVGPTAIDPVMLATLAIVPLSCFALQRTLWRQPDSPASIIALFPMQVCLALCCSLTTFALFVPIAILSDYGVGAKLLRGNYPPLVAFIAIAYLFLGIRFDRRFLLAACCVLVTVTLFGLAVLPSDYVSAIPRTFPAGVAVIGMASALLVRRTGWRWPRIWPFARPGSEPEAGERRVA